VPLTRLQHDCVFSAATFLADAVAPALRPEEVAEFRRIAFEAISEMLHILAVKTVREQSRLNPN
jgi:hypothetical protein